MTSWNRFGYVLFILLLDRCNISLMTLVSIVLLYIKNSELMAENPFCYLKRGLSVISFTKTIFRVPLSRFNREF